jgi:hypothetical protein
MGGYIVTVLNCGATSVGNGVLTVIRAPEMRAVFLGSLTCKNILSVNLIDSQRDDIMRNLRKIPVRGKISEPVK